MMVVYCKKDMLPKIPDHPMMGLRDSEKVKGIPNKILPLVIVFTVRQFDVSHIFIDDNNSCDLI